LQEDDGDLRKVKGFRLQFKTIDKEGASSPPEPTMVTGQADHIFIAIVLLAGCLIVLLAIAILCLIKRRQARRSIEEDLPVWEKDTDQTGKPAEEREDWEAEQEDNEKTGRTERTHRMIARAQRTKKTHRMIARVEGSIR
jgi:flagellar biosynthesis/type III secretory pathway M-ring protein FliF/YscJ